uniref:Uncharacterized protein n=1 Tax=Cacopsylla melanoneura TaxID=428564 RepID=A0A8D9F7Q7_9HEMI
MTVNLQIVVIALFLIGATTAQEILNKEINKEVEISDEQDDADDEISETIGESEPNIHEIKDGFIIDYKNGTTIKKSKIENALTTHRDANTDKSAVISRSDIDQKQVRKMIEDVIEKVINEKLVPKYDNIFKEMKEIKDKENVINTTLEAIQKSQDQLNRTLANERIIDRNNTEIIQTKLEDIEKSGNVTRNRLEKAMVDVNNNIPKQMNDIVEHGDTGNNTNILKKLIEEVHNVKNAMTNEVKSVENKISKEINELKHAQTDATDEKINDNIKLDNTMKHIAQEMYVISNYAKDLKNDTNKIIVMSNKNNDDIRDMKENLTEVSNEVKEKNYLNSGNVVKLLTSVNNESKHEIENAIRLALNLTHNGIENTQNQLKNEFRGFAELQNRLQDENFNTIKNSTKDILQKVINMKEIFTNSNNHQTGTLLELLIKHNLKINETIQNTLHPLIQNHNLTANVLEKFFQTANNTIAKNQNDTVELIKEHITKSEISTRKEISSKLDTIKQDFDSTVETFNNVVNELKNNLNKPRNNQSIEVDLLNTIKSYLDSITARIQVFKNSSNENINQLKNEIIQKLENQHGVLEEGLKNITNKQNFTKEEIVQQLRNTTDSFKNQLNAKYSELREEIAKNLKDIGHKTNSIKEMELEIIKYSKNIEGHVTGDLVPKIGETVSKLLNESATVLQNDLKNNTPKVNHELEKEIRQLQESLKNVKNKLSTNINQLKKQIRADLLNGKAEILNGLDNVQNKQKTNNSDILFAMRNIEGEIKKLREELDDEYRRFESKIEPNLLNIRSVVNTTKEIKEGIEENIQVDNEHWRDFNKTKKHITKAIAELKQNVNLIKLDLERQNINNMEKVFLRSINKSEADLLKHTDSTKKELQNKIDLGTRKNQESKTAILERIENLEKIIQKIINKSSDDASHAVESGRRIEKAVYETKQNLASIIYENRRNLSEQIKESPNETNKVINDSISLLLEKLESLEKNALENSNSKGDQVLDALQNVNKILKNETNENRKGIDLAKTDIITGLQIINDKQDKLNRTIKKYTAAFINRLNNTDKYIINTNKTVMGEIDNVKNSLNTFGSQQVSQDLKIISLQGKIEETKDLMDKTKSDIENDIKDKSVGIMKGIADISTSQSELETNLEKSEQSLNNVIGDTKNQIGKLVNKFEQFRSNSKSIENQQKDIQALTNTDTNKYIADLGKHISQDMTDLKNYFRESNENIILNVHGLADKINNSTSTIVKELKHPKKTAAILELMKKATGQLLNRLITLEKYENDIRNTLKNRTGDVLQDINRTRKVILNTIHSDGAKLKGNILNTRAKIEKEIQDSSAKADTNNAHNVQELVKIKQHQDRIKKSLDDLNALVRKRRRVRRPQGNQTSIDEGINKEKMEIVKKIDDTKIDLIHATDHLTEKIKSIEDKIKCASCDEVKENHEKFPDIFEEIDVTNNDDFDKLSNDQNHAQKFRSKESNIQGEEDIDYGDIKDVNISETGGDDWDDIENDSASEKDEINPKILEALRKT